MNNNIEQRKARAKGGQIEASAYSIIGHREYQQDYAGLILEPDKLLAVVCDGMGGLNGGEAASREAVRLLLSDYDANPPEGQFTDFLCREAAKMDQAVFGLKDENGQALQAGSTVVSVIIQDGNLHWMSVGDSRIYVLRDGNMVAATKDHNYRRELDEALARGDITQEFYAKEAATKRAEALTNFLGMGGIRRMERNSQPLALADGDCILLCSDGLYKRLDEHQIRALLIDNLVSTRVAAKRLVEMAMALAARGQDNTTVIVIRYHTLQEDASNGALL
ncbi:MAG: protein serine/threonine phosphatase 2C family protein [Lachnospiraceae bacterium]|nr:protein serine/threonine phosphatase 2C family protein [Lachnospiraceae bacterium]MCI9184941.1 protein serine/threonine phosphatase 2C family protein [Lachnospiraceae bacterium]